MRLLLCSLAAVAVTVPSAAFAQVGGVSPVPAPPTATRSGSFAATAPGYSGITPFLGSPWEKAVSDAERAERAEQKQRREAEKAARRAEKAARRAEKARKADDAATPSDD